MESHIKKKQVYVNPHPFCHENQLESLTEEMIHFWGQLYSVNKTASLTQAGKQIKKSFFIFEQAFSTPETMQNQMPLDAKRYGRSIKDLDLNTSLLLNNSFKIKRGRRRKEQERKMRRRRRKGWRKQRRRKRNLFFSLGQTKHLGHFQDLKGH